MKKFILSISKCDYPYLFGCYVHKSNPGRLVLGQFSKRDVKWGRSMLKIGEDRKKRLCSMCCYRINYKDLL